MSKPRTFGRVVERTVIVESRTSSAHLHRPRRNDLGVAEARFRHALTLKPDLADAHNNLGNVLKELGRLDDAHQSYSQALALDPSATGVYVN